MSSKEDFFSEFYCPEEILMENEGNVEVLSISHALSIWSQITEQLNNLVCLGFTVKFQTSVWNFCFMDLAQRLGP